MKASQTKLGVELSPAGLFVFDLAEPSAKVAVDQLIFDATRVSGTCAEGYIVAVHGVSQDIAQILPKKVLRDLGVGNHLTPQGRHARPGTNRLRACAGAPTFEWITHR